MKHSQIHGCRSREIVYDLQIVRKENKRTPFRKYIFHSSNFLFIGKVFSEAFLVAGHSISHCQFRRTKNKWSHTGSIVHSVSPAPKQRQKVPNVQLDGGDSTNTPRNLQSCNTTFQLLTVDSPRDYAIATISPLEFHFLITLLFHSF